MAATSRAQSGDTRPLDRETSRLVDHFFRHEWARVTARLARCFGTRHIDLIEDVVQDALLRAMQTWPYTRVPDSPSAWITRVARNLALDALRHRRMALDKTNSIVTFIEQSSQGQPAEVVFQEEIADDLLRMMFACCDPTLPLHAQVTLTLRTLCGFSVREIAQAFRCNTSTVQKRLVRAKQKLRESAVTLDLPPTPDLATRLHGVLTVIYCVFSEGHKASSGDRLVRQELCDEALRLVAILVKHPVGNQPESHALAALMWLTAARLSERVDGDGRIMILEEQARSDWNWSMIKRGLRHLADSADGEHVSAFHLQAGIAACHCVAPDYASTDWERILDLYDQLYAMNPSSVVSLNRAVAIANVHGAEHGLAALGYHADAPRIIADYMYFAVLGEFHNRLGDTAEACSAYRRAIALCDVEPEVAFLKTKLHAAVDEGSL